MTEKMNVPKLRFSEFSFQWEPKKLGELSTIRSASRVHREQWTESGVPFFRSSDVVAAYKGNDNTRAFISNDLFEELSKKSGKPKKDDLLVTGGGSIGIPYLIPNDEPLYFKDADLLWFKNKEALNGYFLYQFLITSTFRRYLESITHTGTISHYTIEQAKSTPIVSPTLPEQRKIASFLSKVDEKIALLTQKKDKLTEYKKGLMKELFNCMWDEQDGQLTFIPPTLRFKAEDGSEFPDWEINKLGTRTKKVGSGATPRGGEKAYSSDGVLFIRSQNVNNNKLLLDEIRFIPEHTDASMKRSRVEANDILLNITGASIGRSCVVPSDFVKGNLNQHVCIIRLVADNPYFVQSYLASYFGEKLIFQGMAGGGREGLNFESIKGFKLPFPSLGEQNKIANFLSAIDQKIDLTNSELEKAKEWKKGLLKQMFV
ncbi:putative Type I site-specific deoxyribonuclease [Vibrio chagasii]|nr:putative Type I site-specific deoxyribonuclease [Vibrio chagasii]CAH7468838.1 putative Type I site-specific deoxyribonuclease [Vibrio chagasii]